MTEPTDSSAHRRQDKLDAIAAVFGPRVALQFGAPQRDTPSEVEAARVAWQKNRLIQHIRDRASAKPAADFPADQTPEKAANRVGVDLTLREHQTATVGEEHPAVLAHMLQDADQVTRVAVLRRLPGRVSRDVMRRLMDREG